MNCVEMKGTVGRNDDRLAELTLMLQYAYHTSLGPLLSLFCDHHCACTAKTMQDSSCN